MTISDNFFLWCKKLKVKESHNRPGVAQRVPGGLGSQISWHAAREHGEVVSLTHRPPLPPGMFLVLIFTIGWIGPRAMVWSEGNMSLKNPVTPPVIDPGTVRLVAQRLNHYATPGPFSVTYPLEKQCKWTLFVQQKTFLTNTDLLWRKHKTENIRRWDDTALSWLALTNRDHTALSAGKWLNKHSRNDLISWTIKEHKIQNLTAFTEAHNQIAQHISVHFNKQCKMSLTLTLLMWRIWWASNNASRWQMGFNLAFKGLIHYM